MVESTYNWYWLVDGLMEAGFQNVRLANPSAIKQYEGIKYTDDQYDAFFLARLLILGILPQPLWDEALTMEDGSTEVSPFVTLAERA